MMSSIGRPIRVLVVDDSVFIRHMITRHLDADPAITVVGSASNGLEALAKIPVLTPDVVTLDVEMPHMDGLAALEQIMAECPTPVVMVSSLTQRGARTTIQALMRGAIDFVAKPASNVATGEVMEELIVKVKAAASARPTSRGVGESGSRGAGPSAPVDRLRAGFPPSIGPRPFRRGDPVVVIGSSTGGPRALQQVLSDLPGDLPAAVVVVQHMPAGFTRSLAQRLNEVSAFAVQEAAEGDRLALGLALLAPGDFHLRFKDSKQLTLDQGPRRNHVRPAVDVTMESAVEHHRSSVIGVVLTGMGSDGSEGAGQIKAAGGKVIAEHESTCVVYGMPRSVVEAHLADRVVPLPEVASTLEELITHGRTRV
jgi:two-component system chemotaxis response regulator CheB